MQHTHKRTHFVHPHMYNNIQYAHSHREKHTWAGKPIKTNVFANRLQSTEKINSVFLLYKVEDVTSPKKKAFILSRVGRDEDDGCHAER